MTKIFLTVILLFSITSFASAWNTDTLRWELQRERRDIGVVVGLHQFRSTWFELGISTSRSRFGGCAFGNYFYGRSLSVEYNPFQKRAGLILSTWTSAAAILTLGANINSYTGTTGTSIGLKPFVGTGPGNVTLTYGYNFQVFNAEARGLNRHCFSLRAHFSVKERGDKNLHY